MLVSKRVLVSAPVTTAVRVAKAAAQHRRRDASLWPMRMALLHTQLFMASTRDLSIAGWVGVRSDKHRYLHAIHMLTNLQ